MPVEKQKTEETTVAIEAETIHPDTLVLKIAGRLDSETTGKAWREATGILDHSSPARLIVEAAEIEYCDGSGIGLLLELHLRQNKTGGAFEIRNLRSEFQQLLSLFNPAEFEKPVNQRLEHDAFPEEVGEATYNYLKDLKLLVAFVGEIVISLINAFLNPRRVRWKDVFHVLETAGIDALPVIALISFIMGLILAFQSAIPMRQFGADIYVANLVALSMLRELGPLMTAIVLVGRSGSAFAAEIGTMKINEEIDAMTTMGIDPFQFLIVPRIVAAFLVTPLLAVYADLIGLIGGSIVVMSLGFPLVTYIQQVVSAVTYIDFMGGLLKSFVFGIVVSAMGCFRGMQTKIGASAVGISTTQAVVSGIILIVFIDGIFSVVYYYLGI
ncbi:MAG TPA: MlaE family lipid ABC transporter permease subunit [Deltaproteobacteria bacterium]|nr:MlaE family lipid ABC transporter permease subunit [Deltaproteobacteria bacterium]